MKTQIKQISYCIKCQKLIWTAGW